MTNSSERIRNLAKGIPAEPLKQANPAKLLSFPALPEREPSKPSSTATHGNGIEHLLVDRRLMESVSQRFWRYVDKSGGPEACWPWKGSRQGYGYGRFKLASYHTVGAHRLAYLLGHGEGLGDLHALHRCDNPPCCNPDHLFAGTNDDNVADKLAKGRQTSPGDQSGDKNRAAKLSASQVEQIRKRIAAGHTNTAIAKDYGVTHQLISRIRRGRSWGEPAMQPPYQSLRYGAPR
jgi:hypothetical protein